MVLYPLLGERKMRERERKKWDGIKMGLWDLNNLLIETLNMPSNTKI